MCNHEVQDAYEEWLERARYTKPEDAPTLEDIQTSKEHHQTMFTMVIHAAAHEQLPYSRMLAHRRHNTVAQGAYR